MLGGIKAVTWSDVQQMCIIFLGLLVSLITVFVLLPKTVSFGDAVFLAGAAGRLNAVTTNFSWNDRFNIWSGLLGGTFLFLSYFGCDPVSYTHLDVYKRQVYSSPDCRRHMPACTK